MTMYWRIAFWLVVSAAALRAADCNDVNASFRGFVRCGDCEASHNIIASSPVVADLDGDGNLDLAALVCLSKKFQEFQGEFCVQKPIPNDPGFDKLKYLNCGEDARRFMKGAGDSRVENFVAVAFGSHPSEFSSTKRKLLLSGGVGMSRVRMSVFKGKVRDWPHVDGDGVTPAPRLKGNALYFESEARDYCTIIYWDRDHFRYHKVDPQ